MEEHHVANLKHYCRCCKSKITKKNLSVSKSKENLKIGPSIKAFLFDNDDEATHPNRVCHL